MIKALGIYNFSLFLSLYITQYIGISFFMEAFVAILRKNGLNLENLGALYALGLIWVLRFLWAPLIDRFTLSAKSHYNAWIVLFQALMVATLFVLAFFDVKNGMKFIILLIVLFAFFSASQDIALDALVIKDINPKNSPFVASLKTAGGLIGTILGGGIGLIIYDYLGWFYTMILLSLITANSLVQIYFYKEKLEDKFDNSKIRIKNFLLFWKGKKRLLWLSFIIFYPACISVAYAIISPILVDMGWELAKIGFYIHTIGYGFGVMVSLLTGTFIKKFNIKKLLIISILGQFFGLFLYLLPLNFMLNDLMITVIVGFIFSLYTISNVIIITLMMNECENIPPATGFAMQHIIYMLASLIFSGISTSLAGVFGYQNVIIGFSSFGLLAIFIATKLNIEKDSNKI